MKKVAIVVSMIWLNFVTLNAQITTIGQAINKASGQRFLIQRMAKDYMAIGAGIRVDEASKELDESAATFNENYQDLVVYAKTKEQKDALDNMAVFWNKFREKITNTPDLATAPAIITESNVLFSSCNLVVDKFVKATGAKVGLLSNISGREKSYSQRMAMFYIANVWQVQYKTIYTEMETTITDFENGLTTLLNASENTEEINTILKLQKTEWDFIKKTFDLTNGKVSPTSVYSSTNLISRNFVKVNDLYEKLVN